MKAAIPTVRTGNQDLDRFCETMKQNMDGITGQQKNSDKIEELPATASNAQIIELLNAIVRRIQ